MSLFAELRRRNVLRVVIAYLAGAWLLIQIADVLWPIYGLSESSLQLLTNLLGIGLIPVVIISWVFEWTPAGLRRDADVAPGESIAPQTGKTLDRIIMVVLVLAVGFFAFDNFAACNGISCSRVFVKIPAGMRSGTNTGSPKKSSQRLNSIFPD